MISDFLTEIMNPKSNKERILREETAVEEKMDEKNVTDNIKYDEEDNEIDNDTEDVQWKRIEGKLWSTCIGLEKFGKAHDMCKTLGGRLPTRAELTNVFDDWSDTAYNIKMSAVEKWHKPELDFWTVSRDRRDEDNEDRWVFNLRSGLSVLKDRAATCYFVCVKDEVDKS